MFFPLRNTKKPTQNAQKTQQSLLILLSSPTKQGIVLIPNLPFLGSTLWILHFGVDVAFLAIIHTHNLLNLFLAFILLFLLE